jgi:hypothetical protein
MKPKTNMKTKQVNATQKIREWLERGHSITPMQALQKWGCMRLGARINDLRNEGWEIITQIVEKDGKRYAKYKAA